jgi:hypothetical protein
MAPLTGPMAPGGGRPAGPATGSTPAPTGSGALTLSGAMSRTMLAPRPAGTIGSADRSESDGRGTGSPATFNGFKTDGGDRRRVPAPSRLVWIAGSVGYIYTYLREKLDAGERRRRVTEERDGAERLLGGAIKELGLIILSQGIQHPDLTGLLEAIGRAEARRETSAADILASEKLQGAEETRLGAHEIALEAAWTAADQASREADDLARGISRESQETANRLARARDARSRLERDAESADATADGRQKAAHLRHEAAGQRSEEQTLEGQLARLDSQLMPVREHSAALRAEAQSARSRLEAAIAIRRTAGSAMKASIAGHSRDRAEAEREVAELTQQLGRAASQSRSPLPMLAAIYQSIDRLEETVADRSQKIAALDLAKYDQKKLLTGVGLLTSLFALMAAVFWVVLKR